MAIDTPGVAEPASALATMASIACSVSGARLAADACKLQANKAVSVIRLPESCRIMVGPWSGKTTGPGRGQQGNDHTVMQAMSGTLVDILEAHNVILTQVAA